MSNIIFLEGITMALSKSRSEADQQQYNHIFNHALMQRRLQLLRNTYQLSMEELEEICAVIGKTTLFNWETGTRIPTVDSLLVYATKFGASIEWLCGLSDEPYTERSVSFAEYKYFTPNNWYVDHIDVRFLNSFNLMSGLKFEETALLNYSNHEQRKNHFSLEARANVLVLLPYPSAISASSRNKTFEEANLSGVNQKKRNKYIQVIDNLKTVINTGNAVYRLPNE